MDQVVGVRELRQHLSRYLDRVRAGEAFVVTDRGVEVARLTPSGASRTGLSRLVAEHGASIPSGRLVDRLGPARPQVGRPTAEVLDELREDRR